MMTLLSSQSRSEPGSGPGERQSPGRGDSHQPSSSQGLAASRGRARQLL